MSIDNELWKPVVGYEGYYEISSQGRVRSLDREIRYKNGRVDFRKGAVKPLRLRQDGYLQFNVSKEGLKAVLIVHVEVAKSFIRPRPTGMVLAHGNGRKSDNRSSNLRYDTQKGNLHDTLDHQTRAAGELHGAAKLTMQAVEHIRSSTESRGVLAEMYGVHRNHISRIRNGHRWVSPVYTK